MTRSLLIYFKILFLPIKYFSHCRSIVYSTSGKSHKWKCCDRVPPTQHNPFRIFKIYICGAIIRHSVFELFRTTGSMIWKSPGMCIFVLMTNYFRNVDSEKWSLQVKEHFKTWNYTAVIFEKKILSTYIFASGCTAFSLFPAYFCGRVQEAVKTFEGWALPLPLEGGFFYLQNQDGNYNEGSFLCMLHIGRNAETLGQKHCVL